MKDSIKTELLRRKPEAAKGHVCIDLTDPITGKVKNRVEGDNYAFPKSLFSGPSFDWKDAISNSFFALNDSPIALDQSIPYLMGQTIGYGRPSQPGLGTFRGAYNAANQVIAALDLTKIRWKFQYDFTTAQANSGTIRNVGLTNQYGYGGASATSKRHISNFTVAQSAQYNLTCDGRYAYSCSTAGVITKYDLWMNTTSTVDVSATVGNSENKWVCYAPMTGKYYVYRYSNTAGTRRMYVFSNNTFANLETSYATSNIVLAGPYPSYVYNNYMFCLLPSNSNDIYKADFVNNTAHQTLTLSAYNNAEYTESTTYGTTTALGNGTIAIPGTSYFVCGLSTGYPARKSPLFDMNTSSIVGYLGTVQNTSYYACCLHPIINTEKMLCDTFGGYLYHNSALTTYILPTPITKTSANGMTATYELEVFW